MTRARTIILATVAAAAILFGGFLLGAWNSFDVWRDDCGLKLSDELRKLGIKPGDRIGE